MAQDNYANFVKLVEFFRQHHTELEPHEYSRKDEALLSSEQIPANLYTIRSERYDIFRGKDIETQLIEMPDIENDEIMGLHLCFNNGNIPVLISQFAKVFPMARKNFHERCITSLVSHLLTIAKNGVKNNRVFFPKTLIPYINPNHSDLEIIKSELQQYNEQPPVYHIFDDSERGNVLESLKIDPTFLEKFRT